MLETVKNVSSLPSTGAASHHCKAHLFLTGGTNGFVYKQTMIPQIFVTEKSLEINTRTHVGANYSHRRSFVYN